MATNTATSWGSKLAGALLAIAVFVFVGSAPAAAAPAELGATTADVPDPGATGILSEDHVIKVCVGWGPAEACVSVTIDDDDGESSPKCLPVSCSGAETVPSR